MKTILIVLLFLSITCGYSQHPLKCGIDDIPQLNSCESELLNEYLKNEKGSFDFTNKKILFITGSSGSTIGSKKSYFEDLKSWNERNERIATTVILLTEKEKVESGGYDAVVTYWVKVFGGTRRVIKKIKQDANKN